MKKTLTNEEYAAALKLWERTYEPHISNDESLDCLDQIQAMFYANPKRKLRELRARRSNPDASTQPCYDKVPANPNLDEAEWKKEWSRINNVPPMHPDSWSYMATRAWRKHRKSMQPSCDTCLDMGIQCQCVDEPLEPTGAKAMTDQWDEKHGPTLEQIADFKAQYPQHAKAMGL